MECHEDRERLMECHEDRERLMECHDDRERLMECHDDRKRTAQALDKPRHHTAKEGVYGAREARLTALRKTATRGSKHSSR